MSEFVESLICSGTSCTSWILVLLSILAVFYLVFCSFYKPVRLVRIFGWIYFAIMLICIIVVLAFHVCLFTLLCSVFTLMLAMAILPIVLPKPKQQQQNKDASADVEEEEQPRKKADRGGYVITQVESGGYVVSLYNAFNKCLATTKMVFPNLRDAKKQITVFKEFGSNAPLENRTKDLVGEISHPKFEMFSKNELYYFTFSIDRTGPIFVSKAFESNIDCAKRVKQAMRAIQSSKVYMATAKLDLEEDKKLEETRVKAILAQKEEARNRKPWAQVVSERWAELRQKWAEDKAERDRKRAERAEEKRIEREQIEREKEERRRIAAEEAEHEKAERERKARELEEIRKLQLVKEEKQRLERERAERERAEKERLALEKIEKQRLRQQKMEEEREERHRLKALQEEEERLAKQRKELEKAEREQLRKEKALRESAEREKAIREHNEAQHAAKKREQQNAAMFTKKFVEIEEKREPNKFGKQKNALELRFEKAKSAETIEELEELDVDPSNPNRILDWSFDAKYNYFGAPTQRRYNEIRNALLSYDLTEGDSWKTKRFYKNNKTFAKVLFKGKIMYLYLALDPEKFRDTKYIYGNAEDIAKFKDTPMRFRVPSDRSLKWAIELINIMMTGAGFEKGVYVPPAFAPEKPRPVDALLKHGLIKEESLVLAQKKADVEVKKPEKQVAQQPAIKIGKNTELKRPVNMAKEIATSAPKTEKAPKKPAKTEKKPVKKQKKAKKAKAKQIVVKPEQPKKAEKPQKVEIKPKKVEKKVEPAKKAKVEKKQPVKQEKKG